MNKVLTVLLMLGVMLPSQVWAESDAEWMRKVTAGLSTSGGNTEKGSLSAEFLMKRERDDDETQLRWTGYLGTSDSKLDSKKFYGLLRHDEKFGEDRTWYQFGKLRRYARCICRHQLPYHTRIWCWSLAIRRR